MCFLRVMIVDDEILVINHLKNLIHWEEYGFEIVADATNPIKAIDHFKKLLPDIVIVDIRMPAMDGLEFSRRILAINSKAKVILLTSYKDFEYAKQALEIGVSKYFLKHELHEDNLVEELGKIKKGLEQQKGIDNILTGKFIVDMLEGRKTNALEAFRGQLDSQGGSNYVFLLLQLDKPFPVMQYDSMIYKKINDISYIEGIDYPEDIVPVYSFPIQEGIWGMLLRTNEYMNSGLLWERICSISYKIQKLFKKQYGQTLTVVTSDLFNNLKCLHEICKVTKKIANHSIFEGREKILRICDDKAIQNPIHFELKTDLENVLKSMEELDVPGTALYIDKLFRMTHADGYDYEGFKTLCNELTKILYGYLQKNHLDMPVFSVDEGGINLSKWYTVSGIHEWFSDEFKNAIDNAKRSRTGSYSKKVQQIVDFLYDHYSADISVNELGDRFCMSGDYLRHIFKEETGQTVLDFITFLRIEKSKKLLVSGKYKVYEIAEMVGYKTAQYFSQVFRKTLGLNPAEFMDERGMTISRLENKA